MERLVDQVRTQVVEQARQVIRTARLAPAALGLRPPALEAGLEPVDAPERAVVDESAGSEDLGIPSPVLEDMQLQAACLRQVDEPLGLRGRARQRLVDDDGQAVLQGSGGLRNVRGVGRGDDHEVEIAR